MTLMYSVLAGLSKLDMFGQVVFLRINGQANYKTTLGGCASVSVMGIMVLIFITNFISFIHKEQLKVISMQEYEDEIDSIVFDEGNFIFAIQVEQDDFISKPYFNISMSQNQYTRTSDGNLVKNSTQITLVPCTIERFTNIFQHYNINFTQQFQQLKLYDFLCPLNNSHVSLGGTYSSSLFEYVDLQVSQCQNNSNGTQSRKCSTPDDSSFKLNLLTINQVNFSSNQIVNPQKPKQTYIQPFLDDSISFTFNKHSTKSASIFFTKYQFSNDESLLPISMIEQETFFVLDSSDVKQDTVQLTDDCYIKLMLKKKPFVSKFQRQYQKFDELLSNIGGILQIVSFFIGIIMIIFNRINYMIELANKIYEFSLNESHTHQVYKNNLQFLKTKATVELKPSQHIVNVENGQNLEVDIRKSFSNGIDYFSNQLTKMFEQNKPIDLDIKIFLNYISCNKLFRDVPRVLLMNKAYDQIIQQSDILTILSRLNEIDKLKEVLLTPKQMVMFNFTPKPLITLEDEELKIDRNLIESRAKTPKRSADEVLFRKMLVKQQKEIQKIKDKQKLKNPFSSSKEGFKSKLQRLRTRISNYAQSKRRQSFMPQPLNNFMYQEIYNAYEDLYQKNDNDPLSQHLIQMLGPELETIYKVCKLLDEEEQKQCSTDKGQQRVISDFQSRNGLIEQELINQQDNIQQE